MSENKVVAKCENGMCEVHVNVEDGLAGMMACCCTIVTALYQSVAEHGEVAKKIFKDFVKSGALFDEKLLDGLMEKHTCKDEEELNELKEKAIARKRLLSILEQLQNCNKDKEEE